MSTKRANLTGETFTRALFGAFPGSGFVLPNPDKILKKSGRTYETLRELKSDPHVWSCIQSRKSGLLSLETMLQPDGCPPAVFDAVSDMVSALPLEQIERDITEAPLFGFQPIEIIWDIASGARKFIYPTALVPKPQEWFFFDSDGKLRFRRAGDFKGELTPDYKILNVRHEASYQNPYGHSLLSKCFLPVTFKQGAFRFWARFTEKFGMPFLIGQYQRGATFEEAEQLAEQMAQMLEDAVIVAPMDVSITVAEPSRSSSTELFRDMIKFCNAEISKAILSQTLTTELDMGSYAATEIHYKVRREVILADIRLVESTLNTFLRYITELNFPDAKPPKFKILIDESDNQQRTERDLKIAQAGNIRFTRDYWKNTYGLRDGDFEMVENT